MCYNNASVLIISILKYILLFRNAFSSRKYLKYTVLSVGGMHIFSLFLVLLKRLFFFFFPSYIKKKLLQKVISHDLVL